MMKHPSRYELDQWVAGELRGDVAAHVDTCETCRAYASRREEERRVLLTQMPAERFFGKLERRARDKSPLGRFGRRVGWAVAAAAAAGILFLAWPSPQGQSGSDTGPRPSADGIRWMGGRFAVRVFVKRGERVFERDDDPIRSGDQVQFEVTPQKDRTGYAAVAAVDGEGSSVVLPSRIESSVDVRGKTLLPGSVDIDGDAAGTELLLIVRTDPFTLSTLKAEIQTLIRDGKDLSSLPGLRYHVRVAR